MSRVPHVLLTCCLSTACAVAAAQAPGADQRAALAGASSGADAHAVDVDGTLDAYVRAALARSPTVREAHGRWAAEVHAIRGAGAPPEPRLSFGWFVQSVETRVGPQRARFSLQQTLPWPTTLLGRRDAAVARAEEAQARFEAVVRDAAAGTQRAYWALWQVRATQRIHTEHLGNLDDLAASLRARVEVGAASLAALQQVDLARARLADGIETMRADERVAEAALRAAVGLPAGADLPTVDAPPPAVDVALDADGLRARAMRHPAVAAAVAREAGEAAGLREARGARAPDLQLGADWILTDPAPDPDVDGSGRDAVMVGLGLRLPLWQGAHGATVRAARAAVAAGASDTERVRLALAEAVEGAHARVASGTRRVGVVRDTLLPQAEATYASVLGAYAVGEAGVAQVLLAQRDLLDLRVQLDEERGALQRAWAELERLCGPDLPAAAPRDEGGTP